MKANRTLVFKILFLTTLDCGLVAAQAASVDARTSDLGCLSFCSIALCPQGTTCGPTPGGGCGCNPDDIIIVEN